MPTYPIFFGKADEQLAQSIISSDSQEEIAGLIPHNSDSQSSYTLISPSPQLKPLFTNANQDDAQAQFQRGEEALDEGRRADAQRWFARAVRPRLTATGEQCEHPDALFMLGYLSYLEGLEKESAIDKQMAFSKAEKTIKKAQALGSEYAQANNYLII